MNNKTCITYLAFAITTLLFSCARPSKKENEKEASPGSVTLHTEDEKYIAIDTKESVITWKGSNSFGTHEGYVSIAKGELMVENGRLQGGTVEVNMNTIADENHQNNSGLIKHLKDPDFFDVEKFPVSAISITRVESTNSEDIKVTANLTIKGITNPVTFPAKMEVRDGIVKANSSLLIDRTNWGIRYKSGKFFDLLADKTISDSIEFNIMIVAKR